MRAYYRTVFEQSVDEVWAVIRNFNDYPVWVEGAGDSYIEEGKSGYEIGAIRNVKLGDKSIRQRLLAQSDIDRSQTYEFCDSEAIPVRNYVATLRVTPVVDGGRTFVEWWSAFDCPTGECAYWAEFYKKSFAGWLASLRNHLAYSLKQN